MGGLQIQEMIKTRKYMENVNIPAPGDGVILVRNVSQGQRFDKGTEMFRIADLSRVWVLVDVFERDAGLVQTDPPVRVNLSNQGKVFTATVSKALPQFDAVSRTLKLRLEADNPEFALKPDMFVDVEFPASLPETLVVPADAVLDAGLRKAVFVDLGNGFFEPRSVETGRRLGDQMQILGGLTAGEKIVVSGNFLLDSESRMKLAAAGMHGATPKDPVCGMTVGEQKARAAKRTSDYQGKTYYFCADGCREEFAANPGKFLKEAPAKMAEASPPAARPAAPAGAAHEAQAAMAMEAKGSPEAAARDPVCGMAVDEAEAKAANRQVRHGGKPYSFCSDICKQKFSKEPGRYLK